MIKEQKNSSSVIARALKAAAFMLLFMLMAGAGTYLTVHLLIRSEDKLVVPELNGKHVVHALEVLTDLGLNAKVRELRFSSDVPKHHIIAQDPEAGTEFKRGRDVRLIISRGARTVIYPNLAGIDLPQAQILLEQNSLRQGYVSYVHHPDRSKQEIVTQFPPAGFKGLHGDAIDLLVSAGPKPVSIGMPDVRGLSLNQAIKIIERDRLVLGAVATVVDPDTADDTITGQTPGAGHRVDVGTPVDLTITRRAKRRAGYRLEDVHLFRYRVAQGFLRQKVRVRIHRPSASFDLFNSFVKPGTEIWLLVPRDVATTLFLYLDGVLAKTEHYD